MIVDDGDFINAEHDPEKDPVAIITPDEPEADQLDNLPLANDRKRSAHLRMSSCLSLGKLTIAVRRGYERAYAFAINGRAQNPR